jgi:hypothetical protein
MASIVRSSVQTESWTEQVAEPSTDRTMRFNRSLERRSDTGVVPPIHLPPQGVLLQLPDEVEDDDQIDDE